ncbi:MAG: type IV pilus twitching motility protein PilT [Planctomycetota bacterium]|nr:type IV pilus twitching motility protein PilT [Planctomycetota bacterium]
MDLDALLVELGQRAGSDLHIKTGRPPLFRISGDLIPQTTYPEVTAEDMKATMLRLMGPERMRIFSQELEADFSYEIPAYARFRVNAFIQRGAIGAVMRLVPLEVPTIEQYGLPDVLKELCDHPNGLVIVTGPTGSGKSTTLAAMIQYINRKYQNHIITIEDPIEFVYTDELCTINQRELGLDTHELHRALRAALRQDPDVILMGEMRDAETIHFAITSAETGHLVFSTLHTNDAKQSLDRILDTFEGTEANQVRMQLSLTLRGIVSQRLVKRADGQGRVAAIEILLNTSHIKELIEKGTTRDLERAIMDGVHYKMQTFNQALHVLWSKGVINEAEALASSSSPEDLQLMMRGIRRGASADELSGPEGAQRGPVVGPTPAGGKAPSKASTPATGGGGDKTLQGPEKKKMSRGFEF